ncbi:MAG TPA: oligosaccharide flippase family protein [Chitinophagaceae bacterium]|nr:oligosaccharide flippase family protein [Chitinophagaceae bacterium]
MIIDTAIAIPEERVPKQAVVKEKENLKQRAYLNTVSSFIDFAGVQLTGIITSPYIVHGLGSGMYGIWQMIGQLTGYAKMADSRATQVLKWTVAKKKAIADEEELRSDISSALVVTMISMPLVLLVGGILSWYAPYITKADPKYYNLIRITCSVLNLSLVLTRVFDLYEGVLRGMNLGYKRIGLRAGVVMIGGTLKVFAITMGYGLIGLSIVQVIVTIITGFTFYIIVKRSVGWFGLGKTSKKKVVAFGKLSGWNMANTITDTLLTQSDKILLGFIATPILVSSYTLTAFLSLAIQGVLFRIIIGILPGVGKLFGLQEYSKIYRVWTNMNDLIFLLLTASGVGIILFNKSFLAAWVGDGHYAGAIANGLIIFMVIQDTFIKNDGYIITATLDLKKKVFLTLVSATTFIVLGCLLIKDFGIVGLCLSLLGGKFLLFVGQRQVLRKKIDYKTSVSFIEKVQPFALSVLMLGAACFLSGIMPPVSLLKTVFLMPLAIIVSFLIFYQLGLQKARRIALVHIIASIKFFKLAA